MSIHSNKPSEVIEPRNHKRQDLNKQHEDNILLKPLKGISQKECKKFSNKSVNVKKTAKDMRNNNNVQAKEYLFNDVDDDTSDFG